MEYIYNIIIQPLVYVYDLLFTVLYRAFQNPVWSIIGLSIVVSTIVLPLYKKADELQKGEQEKKKKMAPWEKHIRKNFRGDEQFMMLSAYYRTEHYNPLNFLKEAVPLLLQVPFFMAAYRFISSLNILNGVSFGPIADLSAPDRLIMIGGFAINILPILMTVINLAAGAIYAKGSTLRLKLQILFTALIFLALLYNSPSGLVIYWTMNNLFSLAKNVVFNFSEKGKKIFKTVCVVLLIALTGWLAYKERMDTILAGVIVIGAVLYIVLVLGQNKIAALVRKFFPKREEGLIPFWTVFLTELALAVLLGLYIPTNVLSASAHEFVDLSTGAFPYDLITYPGCIYFGLLLIWMTVLYFSGGKKKRYLFAVVLSAGLVFALLNQFVFTKSFGNLYTDLRFDGMMFYSLPSLLLNIAVGLLILAGCAYLLYRKPKIMQYIAGVIAAALLVLCVVNIVNIRSDLKTAAAEKKEEVVYDNVFRLSRTGKNVIVMMLDRAIGAYVPYIFDEIPELKEAYSGFVYYPNTISFGGHTNFGAPGLFGGYEYIPTEMNKRDTERLVDKHNEALKLMPVMFLKEGYDVTVTDPPYAGYQSTPDLSIYDDYPEINAYNLRGRFQDAFAAALDDNDFEFRQKRNFLVYGLYRISPLFLKDFLYDDGSYLYNNSGGYSGNLIADYSTLAKFPDLTVVDDNEKNSFLLLQNETPHDPTVLEPPAYEVTASLSGGPVTFADKVLEGRTMKMSRNAHWGHYCINAATYQEVAKWLELMKQEGVYDNTRIILVSDHGFDLGQFSDMVTPEGLDIEGYNPLLMVKDFDAKEPWTVCSDFMTNADVPALAEKGILTDTANPFTGKEVSDAYKHSGEMVLTDSKNWNVAGNDGYRFDIKGGSWWSVHDDIFDMDNWKKLDGEGGDGT